MGERAEHRSAHRHEDEEREEEEEIWHSGGELHVTERGGGGKFGPRLPRTDDDVGEQGELLLGLDEHATDNVDEEECDQDKDRRNGIEQQAVPSAVATHTQHESINLLVMQIARVIHQVCHQ